MNDDDDDDDDDEDDDDDDVQKLNHHIWKKKTNNETAGITVSLNLPNSLRFGPPVVYILQFVSIVLVILLDFHL